MTTTQNGEKTVESKGTNIMEVNHADLHRMIKRLIEIAKAKDMAPPTICIVGDKGIGKSDMVKRIATELDAELHVYIPARRNPNTTTGIPKIEGNWAKWIPFEDFNFEAKDNPNKTCILFIDEATNAPELIQSCLLQVALDRQLENFKFPKNMIIIMAGNLSTHSRASFDFIEPMPSRLALMELKVPDSEAWAIWAGANGVSPMVMAFIRTHPQLLNEENGTSILSATPRGWARGGSLITEDMSPKEMGEIAEQFVGVSAGTAFSGWATIKDKLPIITEAFYGRDSKWKDAVKSRDLGVLIYVMGALTQSPMITKEWKQSFSFIESLPIEFQVICFRMFKNNSVWKETVMANAFEKVTEYIKKWGVKDD